MLYDIPKKKWRKVAENLKVRGWSGSGKLLLIGGDAFEDPHWLIRVNE